MAQLVAVVILLAIGMVLGSAVRPRTVALLGFGLFAIWIVGAGIGFALNSETIAYFFGLTAVAIPFIAVLVFLGSLVGHRMRRRSARSHDGKRDAFAAGDAGHGPPALDAPHEN